MANVHNERAKMSRMERELERKKRYREHLDEQREKVTTQIKALAEDLAQQRAYIEFLEELSDGDEEGQGQGQ